MVDIEPRPIVSYSPPSDAEREIAQGVLLEAVGSGWLSLDEYEVRLNAILRARYSEEIADAVAGLPPATLDVRPRFRWSRPLISIAGAVAAAFAIIGMICTYQAITGREPTALPPASPPPTTPAPSTPSSGPPTTAAVTASPSGLAVPIGTGLPDVVGARLSAALLTLAEAGFANVRFEDHSDSDRMVVNPQNWIVREQYPPPGPDVHLSTAVTLTVEKPSDASGDDAITSGVTPDVVCLDLPTARQRLEAAGFTSVVARDGLPHDRTLIIDSNWLVIAQSVPAGSRLPADRTVTLDAVKYGEPTGSSGCPS